MPIYEFECKSCKGKFEILTSPSRISEARCSVCGSPKVKRIYSTFFSHTSGGSSHSHGGGCSNCSSGNCGSCGCH